MRAATRGRLGTFVTYGEVAAFSWVNRLATVPLSRTTAAEKCLAVRRAVIVPSLHWPPARRRKRRTETATVDGRRETQTSDDDRRKREMTYGRRETTTDRDGRRLTTDRLETGDD